MESALRRKIIDYLEQHNTLTLATGAGGLPWAASLYYVNDGFNLYFLSKPESRHCQYLGRNPAVAATINEDYKNWRKIKGVQLEGTACHVAGKIEKARAMGFYLKKYSFVKDFIYISELKKSLCSVQFYMIIPSTLWFIDNSSGYFNRRKLELKGNK